MAILEAHVDGRVAVSDSTNAPVHQRPRVSRQTGWNISPMRGAVLSHPPLPDPPTIEPLFFRTHGTSATLFIGIIYHTRPYKSVANLRIQSLPSEFLKSLPPVQLSIDLDWLPPVPSPLHPLDMH